MRPLRYVLAATFAAGAAPSAGAQDVSVSPGAEMMVPGNWYVGAGYRYQTIKLPPIVNAMRAFPSANALVTLEPEFHAQGVNGSIGYAFRQGTFPAWVGQNVRAEVHGWWVTARHSSAGGSTGDIPNISLLRVDGVNTGLTGLHLDTESTIRAVSQQWQVALRIASDFPLAHDLILSPEIAVLGSQQYDDYKTFERGQQTNLFQDRRTYDVNTTRIGGHFGGRITYKLREWLAFHIGGYVGAVHTKASVRAQEEFLPNTFTAIYASASSSRSALALITGGQAGITLNVDGPIILAVSGGVDYNTRVAGLRVPTFADPAPTSIVFTEKLNYNVMATLKVRIY